MKTKQKPEFVWMAWSPDSNYLPQAASVSRSVCKEMIRARGFSNKVKAVRVFVQPASTIRQGHQP